MKIFTFLLVVVLASFAMGVLSFDVDRKLITDVVLVREAEQKFLQVDFSAPVRVIGSYPEGEGDILQVKLRTIAFDDFDENLSLLETFVGIEEGKEIYMSHMYYEGNVPGGPFLVLKFDQPVKWSIVESEGLLGLHIIIKQA